MAFFRSCPNRLLFIDYLYAVCTAVGSAMTSRLRAIVGMEASIMSCRSFYDEAGVSGMCYTSNRFTSVIVSGIFYSRLPNNTPLLSPDARYLEIFLIQICHLGHLHQSPLLVQINQNTLYAVSPSRMSSLELYDSHL